MNAAEFKRVFAAASTREDLSDVDDSILEGCALPGFTRVAATVKQCARLLKWQAMNINGTWNMEEVNNMRDIFRHKVDLLD